MVVRWAGRAVVVRGAVGPWQRATRSAARGEDAEWQADRRVAKRRRGKGERLPAIVSRGARALYRRRQRDDSVRPTRRPARRDQADGGDLQGGGRGQGSPSVEGETINRPPHRQIDRQGERDHLSVLLIEEWNSLRDEPEQAQQGDETREPKRPRNPAQSDRKRYQHYQ